MASFFSPLNWFQSSYFRVDTQPKGFWHEKWRTRQRQSVQVIFGSVQCSGTEVWHTHTVPELARRCERLSLRSATEVFSPSLKCDSPIWKITSPSTPAASLLSVFPPVNVLTWPSESPEGKKQNLLSHCSSSFSRSMTTGQGLAFSPFLAPPVQHAGS